MPLQSERDVKAARIVKGRIEKTMLGEVAEYIEEFYSPQECYLAIKLDMNAIEALQLSIHAETVVRSILETKKLKLKTGVRAKGNDIIRIYPPSSGAGDGGDSMLYALQKIKNALPHVIVQGTPNVNRAVINDKGDGTFNLLVEGYNLRGVMTTLGVRGNETTSNHIIEVSNCRALLRAFVASFLRCSRVQLAHLFSFCWFVWFLLLFLRWRRFLASRRLVQRLLVKSTRPWTVTVSPSTPDTCRCWRTS